VNRNLLPYKIVKLLKEESAFLGRNL